MPREPFHATNTQVPPLSIVLHPHGQQSRRGRQHRQRDEDVVVGQADQRLGPRGRPLEEGDDLLRVRGRVGVGVRVRDS